MSLNIVIEGSIGVGKTTILEKLEPLGTILQEPTSQWKSLANFYQEPKQYAYQLQQEIMQTFIERDSQTLGGITLRERSMESAVMVFLPEMCANH